MSSLRVALSCEFDITAKAQSSPSIRARQDARGAEQPILENQSSGLFVLPPPPLVGGLGQQPRVADAHRQRSVALRAKTEQP